MWRKFLSFPIGTVLVRRYSLFQLRISDAGRFRLAACLISPASICRESRASVSLVIRVDFVGVAFVVAAEAQPQHVERRGD